MNYTIGFIFGGIAGWLFAHATVSHECQALGGFYVGDLTFKCEMVKK